MPRTAIPQAVIDKDHELDGRSARAGEALAKHRWKMTLDPDGPQYSFGAYADAVGSSVTVIANNAKGYALFVERASTVLPGSKPSTIEDTIRLAALSAENQAFTEAIAAGSGRPVGQIARGDNMLRPVIIDQARQRAERLGTDPVEEAREIAARHRKTNEMTKRHRAEDVARRSLRFVSIEGKLARAKTFVMEALAEAEDVKFNDEEMELMRATIANLKALLNLIDLRMAGAPDIDWDAEMATLTGRAS